MLKKVFKLYIKHMDNTLDNCTVADAWNMLILSILFFIAGICDLLHLFTFD